MCRNASMACARYGVVVLDAVVDVALSWRHSTSNASGPWRLENPLVTGRPCTIANPSCASRAGAARAQPVRRWSRPVRAGRRRWRRRPRRGRRIRRGSGRFSLAPPSLERGCGPALPGSVLEGHRHLSLARQSSSRQRVAYWCFRLVADLTEGSRRLGRTSPWNRRGCGCAPGAARLLDCSLCRPPADADRRTTPNMGWKWLSGKGRCLRCSSLERSGRNVPRFTRVDGHLP